MKCTGNRGMVVASMLLWGFTSCAYVDRKRQIDGFTALGKNHQGQEEYKHNKSGITFVLVPGGEFRMGDNRVMLEGKHNADPEHTVQLDSFLLAKFEVTQEEWERMISRPHMSWQKFKGQDIPVHGVSWDECAAFCKVAGLKFPTEAQWEYACRGGYKANSKEQLEEDVVHTPRGEDFLNRKPMNAQTRRGNALGLHDMRGNVGEWCLDAYSESFYATREASQRNPVNLEGFENVTRGGAWLSPPEDCDCGWRAGSFPRNRLDGLGVRPAYYPLPSSFQQ